MANQGSFSAVDLADEDRVEATRSII